MQLKLDELDRKIRMHSHFACPYCTIDTSKDEHLKYLTTYARGRQRPLLLHVALTILRCPKCGRQFLTPEFFNVKGRKPF